ncbi:hypothetical protein TYRP_012799 [Tyrophagus putrescentiae]|nr:hypothetical protein TYRP_012799 [Tyrophagus putrescentiae]
MEAASANNKTSSSSSVPASKTTILDLPQKLLLLIFDNIPLTHLRSIDEVCRAWAVLKVEALRRREQLFLVYDDYDLMVTATPNFLDPSLSLVKNDDGSNYFKFDESLTRHTFYIDSQISSIMVDKVVELFPNLKELTISQTLGSVAELWKIKFLLHHYRLQLEHVNIRFISERADDLEGTDLNSVRAEYQSLFASLFTTLNSMTALATLQMKLTLNEGLKAPIKVDLSVASQLKKLTVYTDGFSGTDDLDVDALQDTYEQYAEESEQLQALYTANPLSLDCILYFGPRVSLALRLLNIMDELTEELYEDFEDLFYQCPNIEDLFIGLLGVSITRLVQALAPNCKNLVRLGIQIWDSEEEADGCAVQLKDASPVDQLPVLPSVKSLRLTIKTASHQDLRKLNLDVIFPNVQVIKLHHTFNQCTDCAFQVPKGAEKQIPAGTADAYAHKVHRCMRLGRASFGSSFPKLSTIKADVGLRQLLSSSFRKNVTFTRETLDRETCPVSRCVLCVSEKP